MRIMTWRVSARFWQHWSLSAQAQAPAGRAEGPLGLRRERRGGAAQLRPGQDHAQPVPLRPQGGDLPQGHGNQVRSLLLLEPAGQCCQLAGFFFLADGKERGKDK